MEQLFWKVRFKQIEEAVYMMGELDDMPCWDNLTLKEALEIAKDVSEMCNEENGDWYTNTYDKRQYDKAMRFIREFGKG